MTKIFYKEYGFGIPIFLIHGFASDNTIWDEIATSLSNVHIISPNLPCIGESGGNIEKLSLEYATLKIKKLMESKYISQAFIIGHSMGGYIAQTFTQLYPEKVLGIGLIHSTPIPDTEEKKNNRKKLASFLLDNGPNKFLSIAIPSWFALENREKYDNQIKHLIKVAMLIPQQVLFQYQMAMAGKKNLQFWFDHLDKPKLVLLGKNDDLIPYELQEYLRYNEK
ncbi:MAG: alpha/beta fold hydrolase, partial [Chitinophagaceae bacterium]